MWRRFAKGTVNLTLPSIPIPQSAAWIMLTSFPPSPGKCHCNIQLFRGFTLLALQYFRRLLCIFTFLQLIYGLGLITSAIKTFSCGIKKIAAPFSQNSTFCCRNTQHWPVDKGGSGFVSRLSHWSHLLIFITDLLQISATASEDGANSYLLHTCVFQCGAVTVSRCELFGWENSGSTPQQDTDRPTLQIHAHNTSDRPKEKENKLAFSYD